MKEKKLIIIIAIAVAIYFFLFRKKSSSKNMSGEKEDVADSTMKKAAARAAEQIGESIDAPRMSGIDEEYNQLRMEYQNLIGTTPPASWTSEMISKQITIAKQRRDLVAQLINLQDKQDDETVSEDMTIADIQNMITREQKSQEQIRQQRKQAWTKRKGELDKYVGNMKQFFTTSWSDVTNSTSLLDGMESITEEHEKAYFLRSFGEQKTKYDPSKASLKTANFVGCCEAYSGYMRQLAKYQSIKNTLETLRSKFLNVNLMADLDYEAKFA